MKLRFGQSDPPLEGVLRYLVSEHSLVFDVGSPEAFGRRAGGSGVTSISIGTLQVEVGISTMRALYVWGLHPRSSWSRGDLSPPDAEAIAVFLDPERPLLPGVSISEAAVGEWRSTFDPASGWLRVSRAFHDDERLSLIADSTILGERLGVLNSIWLHPFCE